MNILAKNLLILASAGSGKTFQLANRVIGLVAGGVDPERIVALTFTRKAAGEFADSVLGKLAAAAEDGGEVLRGQAGVPGADFSEALERVVRALPRFTLGTMDGFFSRVVRGFQYELGLTGGKFDLLEGARAAAAADELLADLLGEALAEEGGEEFLHAFRRATLGREGQGVAAGLRGFVKGWQGLYRSKKDWEWGPRELAGVELEEWEERKHGLAAAAERDLDGIVYTDKRQRVALEKAIGRLVEHTIGGGSLNGATSLMEGLLREAASGEGALEVKYYKEFSIGGATGEALREMVGLAARCEMAAALRRTRAVREVVEVYDELCERRLRRRGLLGFDDVKELMGEWARDEDARLRRELVDFRLDARFDHWLLDEFQDTSRAEWRGILPLLDEAAGEGDGTMFIVGDAKQAIYGWRGGEVGLFDEVKARYGGGLEIAPMAESWRSCPEVLDLVNRVCGDGATMRELFGGAADRWEWQEHVSAEPLRRPERRGQARVEVAGGREERLARLVELLGELGVGRRAMTCGVLVRRNSEVREVADLLRGEGFDVIEEGRRQPALDNPVGVALLHLLKWLADPADAYAAEVVEMSPLLERGAGNAERGTGLELWAELTERVAELGFAGMVGGIVEACQEGWSDFGRRRAGDVVAALAELDARGGATPREAAAWVERLEISQSPGAAAVQVMTIHKSKGLGFDVVVLPEVPDDLVPETWRFAVAEGPGWIAQTPPKWARDCLPAMREAEARWAEAQRYEGFCMLYVALTRAKRGLYVLLDELKEDSDRPSLANWVARSVGAGAEGVVFESGRGDWVEGVAGLEVRREAVAAPVLGAATARRERRSPSGEKAGVSGRMAGSAEGMRMGREVHAAFERVGWLDEGGEAPEAVRELLELPEIRVVFERRGRAVELFREQPVEAVLEGRWLSGVIDRLHVVRDEEGRVVELELIDFKTDAVESAEALAGRYAGQMGAYREVLGRAFGGAPVRCLLLATRLGVWVEV